MLWIGYLQWHFRTFASTPPRELLLKNAHNIECRDAVLAWDDIEYVCDERGIPVTRWDGRTMKAHPITGEQVPDERARVPLERYVNPRQAQWPQADFVIGNPPFIGAGPMRGALGDGYVEALRETYTDVPESADYVMHWWYKAAELARSGEVQRFGLITTNSLRQTFNRRLVQQQMQHRRPLSLAFAVPDHPWVDTADGAAVRIAMTVGRAGAEPGTLKQVVAERSGSGEGVDVQLRERDGMIFSDLTVGADVASAVPLASNWGVSSPGVKLHGAGFIVTREQAGRPGLGRIQGLDEHIREYRNGRDLTATPRGVMVIDLYGIDAEEVRRRFPEVYQWVYERVKPERDAKSHSKDGAGYAKLWWIHGKPRQELRRYLAGLPRHIATVETSKHRFFTFMDADILPDNMLVNVAVDDPGMLGVLSSRVHVAWALRAGGRLGVGNDPRYNKTRCYEPFPFPGLTEIGGMSSHISDWSEATVSPKIDQPTATSSHRQTHTSGPDALADAPEKTRPPTERIRAIAEQIDAHRKRQQALHPRLTLTGIYNVLERLRQIAAASDGSGSGAPAAMNDPERREGAPPTSTRTGAPGLIDGEGASDPRAGAGLGAGSAPRRTGRGGAHRLRLGRPDPGPGGKARRHRTADGQAGSAGGGGRRAALAPRNAQRGACSGRGAGTRPLAKAGVSESGRRRCR